MQPAGEGDGGFVGVDIETGDSFLPVSSGIYDIYAAKRQMIDAR